jgi:hypothetical protein
MTGSIYLPNTDAYKARVAICNQCEYKKDKEVIGLVITVCGVCNCPIKTKCVAGPCPKAKWN